VLDAETLRDTLARIPPQVLLDMVEAAFVAFSEGLAVLPAVGEMSFDDPRGDVHIKYGYLRGGDRYVVKVASGFYDNPSRGLPVSTGLMMLFSQQTGRLQALMLDDGLLTRVRTAIAGALAAKYLAPKEISCIGIVGTGTQARLQLEWLRHVTPCRQAMVWGRDDSKALAYAKELCGKGFDVDVATNLQTLGNHCNLIVTTTPSREPVLLASHVRQGTHITAVGADTPDKQEIDSNIIRNAQCVVADSRSQCAKRGEIAKALQQKRVDIASVIELGAIASGRIPGRQSQTDITVADLTGLAVQDLAIASAVLDTLY
jgi:ornithine cyclodeaminase